MIKVRNEIFLMWKQVSDYFNLTGAMIECIIATTRYCT